MDAALYAEMAAANTKRLEELEKEHENNVMDEEDQSQLSGVWQSKLDYLCSIGDSESAKVSHSSSVGYTVEPRKSTLSEPPLKYFLGIGIAGTNPICRKSGT